MYGPTCAPGLHSFSIRSVGRDGVSSACARDISSNFQRRTPRHGEPLAPPTTTTRRRRRKARRRSCSPPPARAAARRRPPTSPPRRRAARPSSSQLRARPLHLFSPFPFPLVGSCFFHPWRGACRSGAGAREQHGGLRAARGGAAGRPRVPAVAVARVSRPDWLRNAAGLVDPSYWRCNLRPRPVLDW